MTGKLDGKTKDWSYATALLSFTANKHLNIALGYDKNFIGDVPVEVVCRHPFATIAQSSIFGKSLSTRIKHVSKNGLVLNITQ